MRLRIFILIILILVVGAVAAVLVIANTTGGGPLADLLPGGPAATATIDISALEPGEPPPTATPSLRLQPVVVARIDLPVGERLRSDILKMEMRPDTNIALQGGYTFTEVDALVGSILKVEVSRGQAILQPMIALNPSDLVNFGSDLALYVDQGKVAIAFPINKFSGAAYAMRTGDLVDVMMTVSLVGVDEEFGTALSNGVQRVNSTALLDGTAFLFPEAIAGRLEFIDEIDAVAEIVPGGASSGSLEAARQVPRRSTQLTIQQATVLWVGTWRDPRELEAAQIEAQARAEASEDGSVPTPTPLPERFERTPDVVILSMSAQDALALKWALESGVNIDLALRAQGDRTVFPTTSVSLPQLVEQGGLRVPEKGEFGIEPPISEVPTPGLPAEPPSGN